MLLPRARLWSSSRLHVPLFGREIANKSTSRDTKCKQPCFLLAGALGLPKEFTQALFAEGCWHKVLSGIGRKRKKKTKQNPLMFRAVCVLEAQWWLFFQIVKVWNEGGCSCLIGFFFCILYGKPVYLPHNHFYTLDSTSPSKWAGKRLTGSLFSRKYSYHLF